MSAHTPSKLPHHWRVARHMVSASGAFLPVGLATLGLGMGIYHWVEGLDWSDAFLNAAMLLGGMGPVDPIHTELGKWLVGLDARLAGLVVIVLAGVMLSPVMHHVLGRLHVKDEP